MVDTILLCSRPLYCLMLSDSRGRNACIIQDVPSLTGRVTFVGTKNSLVEQLRRKCAQKSPFPDYCTFLLAEPETWTRIHPNRILF